jgi:hypothetical protein
MRVAVRQDDIDYGVRGMPGSCPVARALRRYVAPLRPSVLGFQVALYDHYNVQIATLALPDAVRHFVSAFDRGDPVQPFSFGLTLPEALCASK